MRKMKFLVLFAFVISSFCVGCDGKSEDPAPADDPKKAPEKEAVKKQNPEPKKKVEAPAPAEKKGPPVVVIKTSKGDIKVQLNPEKAPITVKNFLQYVDDGFFKGKVFHRVIKSFMIQGGGFTEQLMQPREGLRGPIALEARNGLSNKRGTISMARTSVPNSATSQFFINVVDNGYRLDPAPGNDGYAVFGKVIEGMDVVEMIRNSPTGIRNRMSDVPLELTVIKEVTRADP